MYTIKNIRARAHSVPVTIPLIDEPIEDRQFVTCELETSDGVIGFGFTGHFLPGAIVAAINDYFSPLLTGLDVRDTEAIHHLVWKKLNPRAQTGVVVNALSAVDIAMWDARGKIEGRSIAGMLGGASTRAQAYVTFGFPEYDFDQLVEAAGLQVDDGIDCLKMVVGVHKGGWREDARRVRAVRDKIGPHVQLALDANYSFNPVDARCLARAVEDCNLSWFEEPLHQNDVAALADLRSQTSIPLSAGQMMGDRWQLRDFVASRAVDILQPNVCYCGGYTDSVKVAHMAQCFNIPVMNGGGWPHFNMHLIAGVLNGWRVEFHLGMFQVSRSIFPDAPLIKDNHVEIPDRPGLGMTVDKNFLDETEVKPV